MKPIFAILFVFPCCLASCAKQKSCCPHEFEYSLCSSQTHPKCYCDRACFVRGDCCSDYKQYCLRSESEPCLYDQWTSWSSCSSSRARTASDLSTASTHWNRSWVNGRPMTRSYTSWSTSTRAISHILHKTICITLRPNIMSGLTGCLRTRPTTADGSLNQNSTPRLQHLHI